MMHLPLELSRLNTEQIQRVLEGEALPMVLLPLGSTKPHGPHLPLATDAIIAETACGLAAEALRAKGVAAFVAPLLPYGVSDAAGLPGAISLPQAMVTRLVAELCQALLRDGWRHVSVVNHHLMPEHVASVHAAIVEVNEAGGGTDGEDIVPVSFPNVLSRRWSEVVGDEAGPGACRGGRYETSLVLAATPGLVDRDVQQGLTARPIPPSDDPSVLPAALAQAPWLGDPAQGSEPEGGRIYDRLTDMIVTEVLQALGR